MVNSLFCFSVMGPATSSRKRAVPSLMEVRGVRSSWDIMERKSDFILSTTFNLSHIELKALATSDISGGDEIFRSHWKTPPEISFVFPMTRERGRVMLLVVKKDMAMNKRTAIVDRIIVNLRVERPC